MVRSVNRELVKKKLYPALDNILAIHYQERRINLGKLVGDIYPALNEFVSEYLEMHEDAIFVGMPHEASRRNDVAVDEPQTGFWKDDNTKNWTQTPTGLDTEDDVFPETAASIRWDEDPDHWAFLYGFVEVGSARNIRRIQFRNINGVTDKAFQAVTFQSLLGDDTARIITLNPAILLRARGEIRISCEFENNTDTQFIPLAVHLLPHEVLKAADVDAYVTTFT